MSWLSDEEFKQTCDKIAVRGIVNFEAFNFKHPLTKFNHLAHFKEVSKAVQYCGSFENALKTDLWNEIVEGDRLVYNVLKSKGFKVHFIELSSVLSKFAQDRFPNDDVRCGDIRKMPYPNEYFDFIADLSTSDHFPNFQDALKEYWRTLKPKGILLQSIAYRSWYSKWYKGLVSSIERDQFGDIYGNVQYYFPLKEIEDAQSKFTVLDKRFLYTMQNFRTMRRFFAKFPRLIPALFQLEKMANLKRFGFQYVVIARKDSL